MLMFSGEHLDVVDFSGCKPSLPQEIVTAMSQKLFVLELNTGAYVPLLLLHAQSMLNLSLAFL